MALFQPETIMFKMKQIVNPVVEHSLRGGDESGCQRGSLEIQSQFYKDLILLWLICEAQRLERMS